jgi:two-component system OmpR family sensor kinase
MKSLHARLLAWVLGALTLGSLLLAVVMYFETLDDVGQALDEDLRQIALAMADRPRHVNGAAAQGQPSVEDVPADLDYLTQKWSLDGRLLSSSNPQLRLPFRERSGIERVPGPGGLWRVYTLRSEGGVVQAAQRTAARESLAAELAAELLLPLAVLIVLIGVLIAAALRAGLLPLKRTAAAVARRSAASLEPIATRDLPREIHPLIGALNELMQRLSGAFAAQGRFVADAAHELRSPVTALRLQLQLLERSDDAAQRSAALADLRAGVERAQHLIEQLLQLSRVGPDAPAGALVPLELGALVRDAVARASVRAEHLGLDLGARTGEPLWVAGDRAQLDTLLDSLIDNALLYTPRGGVVDVHAERIDAQAALRVIDSGPGIAPAERERVFDRFYRGAQAAGPGAPPGSGLGLAIVRAIAERHGARVELRDAPAGRGLEARVRFATRAIDHAGAQA